MTHDANALQGEVVDARIAAFRLLKKKVDVGDATAADITALARMARDVEAMLPMRASMNATPQSSLPAYDPAALPFRPQDETEDYVSPEPEDATDA